MIKYPVVCINMVLIDPSRYTKVSTRARIAYKKGIEATNYQVTDLPISEFEYPVLDYGHITDEFNGFKSTLTGHFHPLNDGALRLFRVGDKYGYYSFNERIPLPARYSDQLLGTIDDIHSNDHINDKPKNNLFYGVLTVIGILIISRTF